MMQGKVHLLIFLSLMCFKYLVVPGGREWKIVASVSSALLRINWITIWTQSPPSTPSSQRTPFYPA